MMVVLRWNGTGTTIAGITSSAGSANNKLNTPYDIKLDNELNLYIADAVNCRIQKYLRDNLTGITIAGSAGCGASSTKLIYPAALLRYPNGDMYITDRENNRIQFWPNGANNSTTIAGMTGKYRKQEYVHYHTYYFVWQCSKSTRSST